MEIIIRSKKLIHMSIIFTSLTVPGQPLPWVGYHSGTVKWTICFPRQQLISESLLNHVLNAICAKLVLLMFAAPS